MRLGQRWFRCTALGSSLWTLIKEFTWRRSACCFAVRRAGAAECAGSNSSVDAAVAIIAAAASSCHHYWSPRSAICVCANASAPFAGPAGSCRLATTSRRRPDHRPAHVRARVSPVTPSPTLPFLQNSDAATNKNFSEIFFFERSSLAQPNVAYWSLLITGSVSSLKILPKILSSFTHSAIFNRRLSLKIDFIYFLF